MRREYTSVTNTTYANPDHVTTYVMSQTQSLRGPSAVNHRLTRSLGSVTAFSEHIVKTVSTCRPYAPRPAASTVRPGPDRCSTLAGGAGHTSFDAHTPRSPPRVLPSHRNPPSPQERNKAQANSRPHTQPGPRSSPLAWNSHSATECWLVQPIPGLPLLGYARSSRNASVGTMPS